MHISNLSLTTEKGKINIYQLFISTKIQSLLIITYVLYYMIESIKQYFVIKKFGLILLERLLMPNHSLARSHY